MTEDEARADQRFPDLVRSYREVIGDDALHGADAPERYAVRHLVGGTSVYTRFEPQSDGSCLVFAGGEEPKTIKPKEKSVNVKKGLKDAKRWARERAKAPPPCERCGSTERGADGAGTHRCIEKSEPAPGDLTTQQGSLFA